MTDRASHPTRTGPIPDSYWLIAGMLLAGEYPGTYLAANTPEKLAKFLDAGIRTFIDLIEASEPLAKSDGLLAKCEAPSFTVVRP